jgi:hypothetical protein
VEEMFVAYFEVLFRDFPGNTEGNYKNNRIVGVEDESKTRFFLNKNQKRRTN